MKILWPTSQSESERQRSCRLDICTDYAATRPTQAYTTSQTSTTTQDQIRRNNFISYIGWYGTATARDLAALSCNGSPRTGTVYSFVNRAQKCKVWENIARVNFLLFDFFVRQVLSVCSRLLIQCLIYVFVVVKISVLWPFAIKSKGKVCIRAKCAVSVAISLSEGTINKTNYAHLDQCHGTTLDHINLKL